MVASTEHHLAASMEGLKVALMAVNLARLSVANSAKSLVVNLGVRMVAMTVSSKAAWMEQHLAAPMAHLRAVWKAAHLEKRWAECLEGRWVGNLGVRMAERMDDSMVASTEQYSVALTGCLTAVWTAANWE